jgi:dephospho-CoA kinase
VEQPVSKRWPDKTVIGITGNIATGKSVVRRMLEHLGAFGIDADGLAHRAMSPGAPAYLPTVETFGKWILRRDGQISRQRLAQVVFAAPEALAELEKITHPIVKQVIDLLVKRAKQPVIAIEAIKLIEAGLAEDCDVVWVVDAPRNVQLQRLVDERKLTESVANQRIDVQNPQADKLAQATLTIDNGAGLEQTWQQVQAAYNELMGIKPPVVVEPEPEPEPAVSFEAPITADAEITTRRGGPDQAGDIAAFFNGLNNTSLTRMDILLRFGQKAYMLAFADQHIIGLAGWQVENLIARIDEFVLAPNAPVDRTVDGLVKIIEQSASDLQSEIALLFLEKAVPDTIKQAVLASGYEEKTADELRIPDWKEAARESAPPDSIMVVKRLREDRVLKPM